MTENTTTTPPSVDDLAERFWEGVLELSPVTATLYGDERYADRLPDPSAAGRAAARDLFERTLAEVEAIDPEALSVEERITRDILGVVCRINLEQDDQRVDLLRVVDQIEGPQTLLAQVAQLQPADTPERLDKLVTRLEAYGPYMAANVDLLREGRARGLTAARISAERTIAQMERLLATPLDQAILPAMVHVVDDAARERVRDIVRDVVYPADQAFLEALRAYLPATREDPGLWSAPDGEALYRTQILANTTLDIDPQEVHRIGLEEVASIQAEQRDIAAGAGLRGDLVGYRSSLVADVANHPATPDAMLARAAEDIERALAIAPTVFGRLPRAVCEVKAVEAFKEKDAPFAYYYPPTTDGSRAGIYYANTYDLPSRTYSTLATTTYHEAVPGHHFQISLEMENPNLNTFRRLGSRMAGGAFVEGWGLYSERLADELGLFRNDQERFGMLTGQAWRAARLVVDSGMHGLRWTRQQSIDYLRSVGLTETDSVIETDRYVTWPAQALTYKLGQREIERLRRELMARDGERFDLRTFHDEVLGHGSLPLATLARELPRWVAAPA
jgi:uncharacterized protein (DUF885 family)